MDEPLPLLISIPHGGRDVPEYVQDRVVLTKADIVEDGDAFTREIYDFGRFVHTVVQTSVARAIVDVNRDTKQLPPDHPDGVVKTVTCYNKPVYRQGCFPDQGLIDKLIRDHYEPYHDRIRRALKGGDIVMAFDCHSMAAQAPPIEPNCGQHRPIVNIGNVGGKSFPMDCATEMARCFREVLRLQDKDVTLNEPFSGGFITRTYATDDIPWMQIEISRALYLRRPWFDAATLVVSKQRLSELSDLLREVLQRFCRRIAG